MAKNIIRGKELTTEKENQQVLENGMVLINLQVLNSGSATAHVVLNDGDAIPLKEGEAISLGDVPIASFVIVENGAKIKYIGVEY